VINKDLEQAVKKDLSSFLSVFNGKMKTQKKVEKSHNFNEINDNCNFDQDKDFKYNNSRPILNKMITIEVGNNKLNLKCKLMYRTY